MISKSTVTFLLAPAFLFLSASALADAQKLEQMCANCHGKNGASTEPDVPTISGLPAQLLLANMAAYRNKERPCPETKVRSGSKKGQLTDMCRIAKNISETDANDVAKALSESKFVAAKQPFDAGKAKRGKQLHDQSCEKCHSDGGTTSDDESGILAGQHKAYLDHALKQFMSGERKMPKKMKPKIDKLTPADADALANYYASQQ